MSRHYKKDKRIVSFLFFLSTRLSCRIYTCSTFRHQVLNRHPILTVGFDGCRLWDVPASVWVGRMQMYAPRTVDTYGSSHKIHRLAISDDTSSSTSRCMHIPMYGYVVILQRTYGCPMNAVRWSFFRPDDTINRGTEGIVFISDNVIIQLCHSLTTLRLQERHCGSSES